MEVTEPGKISKVLDIGSGQLATISPVLMKIYLGKGDWTPALAVFASGILISFLYDILTTLIEVVFLNKLIPSGVNRLMVMLASAAGGYLTSSYLLEEQGTPMFLTMLSTALLAMTFYKSGGKEVWHAVGLNSEALIQSKKEAAIAKEQGVG